MRVTFADAEVHYSARTELKCDVVTSRKSDRLSKSFHCEAQRKMTLLFTLKLHMRPLMCCCTTLRNTWYTSSLAVAATNALVLRQHMLTNLTTSIRRCEHYRQANACKTKRLQESVVGGPTSPLCSAPFMLYVPIIFIVQPRTRRRTKRTTSVV